MAYQQDYLEDYIPDLSGYNGLAILIGMDYSTTDKLDTLQGTQVDMIRLGETFSFLKFAVLKLENLAKHELVARLSFITHNKITCNRLVVVFSGHGKMGELYVQDGKTIKTDEFFDQFSPTKTGTRIADVQLFFVDTCRGDAVDYGTIASRGGIPKEKRHPCIDNVLIAYSTTPQHKAYECKGRVGLWLSWLARELQQSDKAITEVLVDVNCHLRNECQRNGTAFQTAEYTSYLTENVYLRKEALPSIPKLDVTVKSKLHLIRIANWCAYVCVHMCACVCICDVYLCV